MTTDPTAAPSGSAIPYQPALDGVRAVAVVLVLAFHLQWPGVSGGYLGVSLFFTLSGYLITRLLLAEIEVSGQLRLGHYLARRARRLLPAGLLGLVLVIALAAGGVFGRSTDLRGSIWAAVAQVFNWYELGTGDSYAELFTSPSPIAHYWSLAIEEQFYWLWPLILLAAAGTARADVARRLSRVVVVGFVVTALAAPLTALLWSPDAAYLATWARASEILAGAVLAVLVTRRVPVGRLAPVAPVVLAVVLAVVAITPAGHGWAYHGFLPLFAILSATLLASLHGESVVRRALSTRPAVGIGRISYGIYVYHWPLILWLDRERLGTDGWRLDLVRLAVVLAAATLSHRFVERPIRQGRHLPGRVVGPSAIAACGVVAILALAVPVTSSPPPAPLILAATTTSVPVSGGTDATPVASGPSDGEASTSDGTGGVDPSVPAAPPTVTPPATTPAEPVVLVVFGDSVPAWLLRDAAATFERTDVVIVNGAREACDGMVDQPDGRDRRGAILTEPDECESWPTSYPATLALAPRRPDAAVLVVGQTPTVDRSIGGAWVHPCDGIGWYTTDLAARTDWLRDQGIPPVLALPARPGRGADWMLPDDFRERYDCVRADLAAFVAEHDLASIDLDGRLCPDGRCDDTRVDGVHVRPELANDVLDWLLDEVLARIG